MEEFIRKYLVSDQEYQDKIAAIAGEVEQKGTAYAALCQHIEQSGFWGRLKTYFRNRNEMTSILTALERCNRSLRHQQNSREQLKTNLLSLVIQKAVNEHPMAVDLIRVQAQLDEMTRMEQDHKRLAELGERALRDVGRAAASVSSAQTMETLDLFTKDKGISMLSSISNNSANDGIHQAKQSVRRFVDAIGEHQGLVSSLNHSMSAELFDLGMDFSGLNDGVDIGSVLSLANLASASSSLKSLEYQLKDIVTALNQTASSSEAECRLIHEQFLDMKRQACLPVYEMLVGNGVDVSQKQYQSAVMACRIQN
ncbi:hypothetical protein ACET98_14385 [Aeromonas veronii]|uniref:hypothetical protein n=1 Tax=Aeromonas sp. R7-5 TaxID=3138477 RepID=UPI0034A55F72